MTDDADRLRRPTGRGNFTPEVEAFLARRTAAFQRISGRGMPLVWGAGKTVRPGFEPKPRQRTKRRK